MISIRKVWAPCSFLTRKMDKKYVADMGLANKQNGYTYSNEY